MADDDANKLRKVTLTNNDVGPRYAHTARGMEPVQSGASLDTEMTIAQIDALDDELVHGTDDVERWTVEATTGEGENYGNQPDGVAALSKLSVTKLREIAAAEEVPLTGRKGADDQDLPDLKKGAEIAAAIQAKRDAAA